MAKPGNPNTGAVYTQRLQVSDYLFPANDGSTNMVITTDGFGRLSFTDPTDISGIVGGAGNGVDNRLVRWDGSEDIQSSLVTLTDAGTMTGIVNLETGGIGGSPFTATDTAVAMVAVGGVPTFDGSTATSLIAGSRNSRIGISFTTAILGDNLSDISNSSRVVLAGGNQNSVGSSERVLIGGSNLNTVTDSALIGLFGTFSTVSISSDSVGSLASDTNNINGGSKIGLVASIANDISNSDRIAFVAADTNSVETSNRVALESSSGITVTDSALIGTMASFVTTCTSCGSVASIASDTNDILLGVNTTLISSIRNDLQNCRHATFLGAIDCSLAMSEQASIMSSSIVTSVSGAYTRNAVIGSDTVDFINPGRSNCVVLASSGVDDSGLPVTPAASSNNLVYGGVGGPRTWLIDSNTGTFYSATGTYTTPVPDFAEYFENDVKGTVLPVGTLVTLNNGKVKAADSNSNVVLGIVSSNPGVVLGGADLHWQGVHMRDKWNRVMFGLQPDAGWTPDLSAGEIEADRPSYEQPIPNPDYDPTYPYTNRKKRPEEWSCVGMIGQILTRVGAGVTANMFIKPNNKGVGIESVEKTSIYCMKITSAYNAIDGYAVALCTKGIF